MGGIKMLLMALLWILLKAQMMSVGALGGSPGTPRNGARARDGNEDRESDKMGDEGLP